ncbi:MAG: twin-arginine translocation signal domain-containing protein, partial [Bacteroidota bacterium]
MNHLSRRNFLKKTGLSSLGLWAGIGSLPGCKNKNFSSIKKNWVWITPSTEWSTDEWKKLFEKLLQHNITGTHVQIYSSHMALYETPWLPVIKPILEKIIPLAAAAGIELHAWMWSMPNNNPFYVENHPEFYVVNRLGQPAHSHPAYVDYYRFMCPNQPGVQEFMHRNVSSLISTEGLQGVHFDYIRMPDVIIAEALQPVYEIVQKSELPAYDYCYCPVCRSKFKEQTGADPLIDLSDPAADAAWRQFRYDSVTHLVNDILLPVVHNSGLKATAAVFPNWESVRQQWN